jgi:hypothetical protein
MDADRGRIAGHNAIMDWIIREIGMFVDDLRYECATASPIVMSLLRSEEGRGAAMYLSTTTQS